MVSAVCVCDHVPFIVKGMLLCSLSDPGGCAHLCHILGPCGQHPHSPMGVHILCPLSSKHLTLGPPPGLLGIVKFYKLTVIWSDKIV